MVWSWFWPGCRTARVCPEPVLRCTTADSRGLGTIEWTGLVTIKVKSGNKLGVKTCGGYLASLVHSIFTSCSYEIRIKESSRQFD
ncbi:hypothetical protein SUGI_1028200 [Cryptomeria japonica]|nr:hypothetical protein SUGI_1028200 [Cryptomeria japonica]